MRSTSKDWPTSLRLYVYPQLGDKPVSEITSADLLQVLAPIWRAKPETARRVRQRIGAIMKRAVGMEHCADNPACEALGEALRRQQDVVRHMPAVPHAEVGAAVEAVRTSGAWVGRKLPFEYLVLTAARSAEVRLSIWDEIDLEAAVWTVPGSRMKAKRPHRVPLCHRAVEIVEGGAKALRGDTPSPGNALVFPSGRGRASRPCRTAFDRRCATGPPSGRTIRASSSRRARARRWEQGGGSLCEVGPVRAPEAAHGRVGGVPRPPRRQRVITRRRGNGLAAVGIAFTCRTTFGSGEPARPMAGVRGGGRGVPPASRNVGTLRGLARGAWRPMSRICSRHGLGDRFPPWRRGVGVSRTVGGGRHGRRDRVAGGDAFVLRTGRRRSAARGGPTHLQRHAHPRAGASRDLGCRRLVFAVAVAVGAGRSARGAAGAGYARYHADRRVPAGGHAATHVVASASRQRRRRGASRRWAAWPVS